MNKKILAAALAASFVTSFAMADVTLYGFMSGSVESVKASGGSATYPSQSRVEDENSRIGFKGNEDLGNGTQTIWQIENSLKNFANGGTNDKGQAATLATRNTFVGLSNSSYGTVVAGYYDSAYKRLTTTNIGTNIMADTTADTNAANAVVTRGDARLANSVHYLSPVWNGLQAAASWGADETYVGSGSQQHDSFAVNYTYNALLVAAGYDHQGSTSVTFSSGVPSYGKHVVGADTQFSKLAASYKFETGTFLAGQFEHAEYGQVGASNMTQDDWTIAVSQMIGDRASIKLSYNKLEDLKNAATPGNYDAKQWVLGGSYALSKTTLLQAYYTQLTNNSLQNADFGVAPIYTSGLGTSSAALAAGSKLTALGVGLKVSF